MHIEKSIVTAACTFGFVYIYTELTLYKACSGVDLDEQSSDSILTLDNCMLSSVQQIATIVPADSPIEMVFYVKNMDIADIKVGMEAEIKLEAYPYNKYGTVKGTLKYISPSSFNSEQLGSVYLVKLDVDNSNPNINVMSGLSGSVEVKIGKQSVMRYFLDPIMKGFWESLKEK